MTDAFGFTRFRDRVEFSEGGIDPVEEIDAVIAAFDERKAQDGYVYPPSGQGPWVLHRLPATHSLTLRTGTSRDESRRTLGGLIIHLFGLLTGSRCQFADWWVDGRVSTSSENGFAAHVGWEVGQSLDAAVPVWDRMQVRDRLVTTNALFLHNRTAVYFWDWERFQAEYQVLDSLYAVARAKGEVHKCPHRERMRTLAEAYGLAMDHDRMTRIAGLRNDLVHQALWSEGVPTTAVDDFAFRSPYWLHRFNARLALAVLHIPAEVVHSYW